MISGASSVCTRPFMAEKNIYVLSLFVLCRLTFLMYNVTKDAWGVAMETEHAFLEIHFLKKLTIPSSKKQHIYMYEKVFLHDAY